MNAVTRKRHKQEQYADMTRPVVFSFLFHFIVFAVASLGLPYWWNPPPDSDEIIMTVDLVDIADAPTAPIFDKPDDRDDDAPPLPKKPVYNTSSSAPDLLSPQEPDLSDVPLPENIEKPDKIAIETPPKPKNKPKPKPKPVERPDDKQEDKKEDDNNQINNLLKSLVNEEDDQSDTREEDNADRGGQVSQLSPVSAQLLGSMERSLNNGIRKCWNVDAGGKNAHTQKVELEVFVNRDKTVYKVQFVEIIRYNTDSHYRAAADAARRALLNRNCWPLNLPDDRYDLWKHFIYDFDPSAITR